MIKHIVFPVETASRELLYKLFLCKEFSEQGYNCFIGNKRVVHKLIGRINNFIYFDKGYHKGVSESIYRMIKEREGVIISLDEEGAVDFNDNSTLLSRYSPEMIRSVDHIFLWGYQQLKILEQSYVDTNKITVSGHPRFQLLHQEFRWLYQNQVDEILSKYGDFILVNTNMGFGNNIKGEEFVKENYTSRIKNLENMIEFDKLKKNSIINMVQKLSSTIKNKIIIRPHPEEDLSTYKNALRGLNNVEVVYEGSVVPWLIACQNLIHTDCTTAIEFYFLGRTPYSFLPEIYDERLVTYLPRKVSRIYHDAEELVQQLLAKDLSLLDSDANREIENYFSNSGDSIGTICRKIVSNYPPDDSESVRIMFKPLDVMVESINKYLIKRLTSNDRLKLSENKLKGFSKSGVNSTMKLIESTINYSLRVNEIFPDLYLIERSDAFR